MYTRVMQSDLDKKFINRIIIVAAVLEPMFVLPQVIQIFRDKSAEGVSIITWLGLSVLTGMWVWYAYVNKEKMVLLYQGLFFTFNTMVIVGALIYGGKWY